MLINGNQLINVYYLMQLLNLHMINLRNLIIIGYLLPFDIVISDIYILSIFFKLLNNLQI